VITSNTWHPIGALTLDDVWTIAVELRGELDVVERGRRRHTKCWRSGVPACWCTPGGPVVPHSAVTHFMVVVLPEGLRFE